MAKKWTDEERKAFGDKMKALKAAKTKTTKTDTYTETVQPSAAAPAQDKQDLLLETLIKMVEGMQSSRDDPRQQNQLTPNANNIINRYPIDKDFYVDPVPELLTFADTSMPAMAVRTLYDLVWELTDRPYESKQGVWYNEPWHIVHIYKRMFDDQGEPVVSVDEQGNRDEVVIDWRTGYFFEDDVLVQQYINQQGMTNYDTTDIANQLRIARMKRWLRDT